MSERQIRAALRAIFWTLFIIAGIWAISALLGDKPVTLEDGSRVDESYGAPRNE